MPSSQIFAKAYQLSGTPTDGGGFTLYGKTKSSVTVLNTGGTNDNTGILGDIGNPANGPTSGDALTSAGMDNGTAYYWGTGTVGAMKGMIVYDPQRKNY